MDLNLQIIEETDFLHITAVGKLTTLAEYKRMQERYFEEVMKRAYKKILIDDRPLTFPKGLIDQATIVQFYQDASVFPGIRSLRVASLYLPEDQQLAEFWETCSFNRGFNFRVFPDVEAAKTWLLS